MKEKIYLDSDIVIYKNIFDDVNKIIDPVVNDILVNSRNTWHFCDEKNLMLNPFLKNKMFYPLGLEKMNPVAARISDMAIAQQKRELVQEYVDSNISKLIIEYVKEFEIKLKSKDQWCLISSSNTKNSETFIDVNDKNPTAVSFLINLNENYDGGEISFINRLGNEKYRMPANSLLIYPSNYEHTLHAVSAGTQYLLISFGLENPIVDSKIPN